MDGRESSGAKREHLPTGSTPSKPQRKRVRNQSSSVRKPLFTDHSSESTTDRDFKSPNRKVTLQILKAKSNIVSPLRKSPVRRHKWTYEEERALVEFISIGKTDPKYGFDRETEWPCFRDGHSFWKDAAMHIKTSTSARLHSRLLHYYFTPDPVNRSS